jgi:hypothetical protein
MKYMVVEKFKAGQKPLVYERLQEKGRMLPDGLTYIDSWIDGDLRRIIAAARDFWQLMCGAHIRYNCLLQDRHGTSGLREEFETEWKDWMTQLQSFLWDQWDTGFLWEMTKHHHRRVREHTVQFVESWIDGVHGDATTSSLDELVTRQERFNKKSRARLHPTADESVGKWVGISDLNYRLNEARTIIRDIHTGLTASEDDDAGY